MGNFRKLINTYDDELPAAVSEITLGMHTATHVDAPSHFVKKYFDQGVGVEELDLAVLNGKAPAWHEVSLLSKACGSVCAYMAVTLHSAAMRKFSM